MPDDHVTIVGAGFGGLAAALVAASAGFGVTVVERTSAPGGKARSIQGVAAGPTVLTMRPVFDALFERFGERLDDHVRMTKAELLARHFWEPGEGLDLFADPARSSDAIGVFAGSVAARGYDSFCAEAKRIFETLDRPFIKSSATNPIGLSWRIGLSRMRSLWGIKPWEPLWQALGRHFADPRLCQLFGRYATYSGSSPFQAPATLMLIAHVEAQGVWLVEGGVQALAAALAGLAERQGVRFVYGEEWHGPPCGPTIFNGDPAQWSKPIVERHRSLSAMVWTGLGHCDAFPLAHHNVFFSKDYKAEFDAIRTGRVPDDPTIYVCAQDRDGSALPTALDRDRLQFIVNAPANGDRRKYNQKECHTCLTRIESRFSRSGMIIRGLSGSFTTPDMFEGLFPGSGGALYGRATHGSMAAFQRPGPRTRTPGLYLAGGSTHPGAGVPMATLSGLQAAYALLEDRVSTRRLFPVAMPGGISTRSAMTGSTA